MLASLRHRAVGSGDHQDGAVHLRGAGDHVLDVIGVARAIDVRVVPLGGFILHVRRRDGDSAGNFSSGALSIGNRSSGTYTFGLCFAKVLVMAAVKVVLP